MKNTALTHIHEQLGAKMVPFAGYNMPVQYEGVIVEHLTVRNDLGVFDVSHMGEFFLKGENAENLIQKITTNDISKIGIGTAQYTCMPNYDDGIIDDLIIYKIANDEFMLVVNASNIEKDWNWISKHNDLNVVMENRSENWSLLAIQGPKAAEAMQSLTDVSLSEIKFYTFKNTDFAGVKNVIVSATGYTGSGGFEVYVKNEDAEQVWNAVFEAGKDFGIKPIGLAARDTLRLEMGYCLYGNDINDTTSPIEAGLSWITKFNNDFINAESLKKQKEQGVSKKLVGFELNQKGIPRKDYTILDSNANEIGIVTSGTMSPNLEKGIGLGYVTTESSRVGTEILIQIRKRQIPATVVKLPFYKG